MVNYINSKVYKIEPIGDHNEGDIYFGSTTKTYLCQRMQEHVSTYKYRDTMKCKAKYSVFDIFEKYGPDNCHILLMEAVECKTKDELRNREAHYIRTIKCINKLMPSLLPSERDERRLLKNEQQNKRKKTDTYRTQCRETRKNAPSLICECGCIIRRHVSRHRKTKKHIELMAKKNL